MSSLNRRSAELPEPSVVHDDQRATCRLTKFSSLTNALSVSESPNGAPSPDQASNDLLQQVAANKSANHKLHQLAWPPDQKKQKKQKSQKDQKSQEDQKGQKKRPGQQFDEPNQSGEPFQVVWQDISFKIGPSAGEKLLDGLRDAWSCLKGGLARGWPALEKPPDGGRSNERVIFERLSGYFNSGELTAILGPSGAGKTSLLSALCGRQTNFGGSIRLVGGKEREMRLSIIPQKDHLNEHLTVEENLLYSSKILNYSQSDFDHHQNIRRVVVMLKLTHCLHSSVGSISGGEYKRVSIAQALLRQPDILVLDEPTSGLDSLNCKRLVRSLNQLVDASRRDSVRPIAIVMTIHQPDVDVFNMFDHIYCMARAGRVIFDGPPSEAMRTIERFAGLDLSGQIDDEGRASPSTNPANLLIEIASGDLYGQEPIERLAQVQRKQMSAFLGAQGALGAAARAGNLPGLVGLSPAQRLEPEADLESAKSPEPTGLVRDKRLDGRSDHSGRFWYHTNLLAKREFACSMRDPLMTIVSLVFHLSIPVVMWTVYGSRIGRVKACPLLPRDMEIVSMASNETLGKIEHLQEQVVTAYECATMFLLTTYSFSLCSASLAALAFPLNMHILLKEVRNGWYQLPSYVLAKTIASFPFEVLFPVLSLMLIYVILDMPSSYLAWRVCAIALVMALISMISHTQGLIFGTLCMDSIQTAVFMATTLTLPQILLSGFLARTKFMPFLLEKLSYLSQYRYSSSLINIIRFGFGLCPCNQATDEYLQAVEPNFVDVPSNLKPVLSYYLLNLDSELATTTTSGPLIEGNATSSIATTLAPIYITTMGLANATLASVLSAAANQTDLAELANRTFADQLQEADRINGISYDFLLNITERDHLRALHDADQLDLFGRLADLLARSFAYGRKLDRCKSVRSQILATLGMPPDDHLLSLFIAMSSLMLGLKLLLFLLVRLKIGSRV